MVAARHMYHLRRLSGDRRHRKLDRAVAVANHRCHRRRRSSDLRQLNKEGEKGAANDYCHRRSLCGDRRRRKSRGPSWQVGPGTTVVSTTVTANIA